jgi:hypothetical protein
MATNARFLLFLFALLVPNLGLAQYPLFKNIGPNDGLPSSRIFDVATDKNGNLWVASDKGAAVFTGKKWVLVNVPGGDNEIIKLYPDKAGKMWFCSSTGKIYYSGGEKAAIFSPGVEISKKLAFKLINQLALGPQDDLWISTVIGGGLYKISSSSPPAAFYTAANQEFAYYVKEASKGQYICGSSGREAANNKLRVFFDTHQMDVTLSSPGPGFSKSQFARLMDESFLFAKGHEIVHFNENVVVSRAFVEKSVECLFEDAEGKIWAGLNGGGVVCYPSGILSSGTSINYLGVKTITGICEDKAGNLWFSSLEDGLFRFSSTIVSSYTPPKIFSSDKPSRPMVPATKARNAEETIAMPEVQEVKINIPEKIHADTMPPAVFISGIKILNRDTTLHNSYHLEHFQNYLKLAFAGLSADKSQNLQYKYMLQGIDGDWIYTNNTHAHYTSLPAGDYLFKVSAMNRNGVWSDKPATVRFKIQPPIWDTWWFRGSVGGVFTASILLLFVFRDRKIKKKEWEKALISKKINSLELQALRAQMNPHFVYNTLSSIQHYITENNSDSAIKYLTKFARLMRVIMDNSSKPLIPIKDELQALELYLELESVRCTGKFSYTVNISSEIDIDYDQIPSMLIQPYVENAIWHGLMLREEGGHLLISLSIEGSLIKCIIEDNGIGRRRSAELKKSNHKSLGMSITKERLEILNSLHGSQLSVEIVDLVNDAGEAAGTRVVIYIPA